MTQETLFYRNSEGITREIKGCKLTEDKYGRFWIWSDSLGHNLAYKIGNKEDALIASISSLLSTIERKNEQIAELREIYDLAMQMADRIKPDYED